MRFKLLLRALGKNKCTYQYFCHYSTEAEIVIPKRIQRGPTDILKALASTVKRDPTAPHYKYHDDPYLIPYSNFTKRSYALSQESGRKAAQWIRQQHADLFQHKVAEPLIEAYLPKPEYNAESEVNEDVLNKLISNSFVSDAVIVYNLLKNKQIDLTSSTKLSFLELLCYFNEEEPISEEWIEERWYSLGSKSRKDHKTWKDGGLAEQLFEELKNDEVGSYSAIVGGMCKHGQVQKAYELYLEAISKNVPLTVEAYNALLSKIRSLNESHQKMWELIQSILRDMSERKVKPNILTMNSILESLSKMSTNKNANKYALQVITEFKLLGIEPSLSTFYFLLEIFIKSKDQLSGVLSYILDYSNNKNYTICDVKDVLFFSRAMDVCSYQLRNMEFAYRLHNLLLSGNNYNLIGDSFSESLYYRYFFFLLTESEELSKVMEFYDDLVPNVYIPEPAVMIALLRCIRNNMAWDLLPRFWSDILLFDQAELTGILENVLECASQNTDHMLQEDMSKIAWAAWEKVEGIKRERSSLQWTASALGNILLILMKAGEKAKANLVMDKMCRLGSSLMNEPKIEGLNLYIDSCIEESAPEVAIKCIQYCNDVGFMETSEFARRLHSSIELNPQLLQKLKSIVGESCLQSKIESSS